MELHVNQLAFMAEIEVGNPNPVLRDLFLPTRELAVPLRFHTCSVTDL